jgi:aspartyl-tRNA(Asn)/glutamyl-tRNA(Gln) amidotransferase subunit A
MKLDDLIFLPIERLAPLVAKKKVSPVELTRALLERIERLDRGRSGPRLNAYLTVTAERALADAQRAETEIARCRDRGPLHGIPISLKDNFWTRGIRSTAGSKFLRDFVPDRDSVVAQRLRNAGAVLLGKTNLHEFAYGVTTENPHFGPTRNPWDTARIPGGSSGGSAAAIAAGLCYASVGSDTGGSIRIPAALCGIVGLKPAFGRVSCEGLVPLAPTFDHAGPLARSVADAALMLAAIAAGPGGKAFHFSAADLRVLDRPVRKLRLGWPREYFWEKLDPEVRARAESAARFFEGEGAELEEVSLPLLAESVEPSTHIALAEARHFHERAGYFPAHAADYGEDVRKRLEMGADVRATDYLKALDVCKQVRAGFEAALTRVDAILAPTVPVAAPRIGEKLVRAGDEEEPVRGALLRLNRPANLTGHPAISIPCGFTRAGLPIGLQLIGRMWDELHLLRIARLYERAHNWMARRPPLS